MSFEEMIMNNMQDYFKENSFAKWKDIYRKKQANIAHDEPWLTLVSLYSIFGDQSDFSDDSIQALQDILSTSGFNRKVKVTTITEVSIEKILPEIKKYREYLYEILKKGGKLHLYPDRNITLNERIKSKLSKNSNKEASLEGNTNLDAQITFNADGRSKYLFIEAKLLSDIDTKTTYNPLRNQIIRNIDAMIDFVESEEDVKFDDVYFSLLTPKIFRTDKFSGNKTTCLDTFTPQKSRFYCYIMDEYKSIDALKRDLPHRELSEKEWEHIRDNIGWMTFDDMYTAAKNNDTISSHHLEYDNFFAERNLG